MIPTFKFALALIGLGLLPSVSLFAEEAASTGKVSKRIKQAILIGLPAYNGQIVEAPVETPLLEIADPDLLILPVVKVSHFGGLRNSDEFKTPLKTEAIPLVAGTGVTEYRGKRFTILTQRILFIPVALKIKW